MQFVVVIPARFGASRLPGKPLADIGGKPMICHVLAAALASNAARVLVATDHPEIADVVRAAGGEVSITSPAHQSGSERLAETVEQLTLPDDAIVVNVQGDEPMIPPVLINQVAEQLARSQRSMATLSTPIRSREELFDPNMVRVIVDSHGDAIYFSRAPIPWPRESAELEWQLSEGGYPTSANADPVLASWRGYQRHIGLYSYRAGFIRRYVTWAATPLETIEKLEQLRVIWYGEKISVATAAVPAPGGIDTPEDLELVRRMWLKMGEIQPDN